LAAPNPVAMTDGVDPDWPADAVEVGTIVDAWGIKGWIKVQPHASDPQALFSTKRWFVQSTEGVRGARRVRSLLRIVQAREHGESVVAQVRDVADRAAAEALRGARVFVSRGSFPSTAPDEYYWVDLIGLDVVNREGEALGAVVGLLDTGPHCVLRVASPQIPAGQAGSDSERLIPFVSSYVDSVDLAERRIVVDWGLDF
jgi:16S rRNA processing protein RimM